MQTLDYVSGLHNCREFSQLSLLFRWGYGNTENVLYCLIIRWVIPGNYYTVSRNSNVMVPYETPIIA